MSPILLFLLCCGICTADLDFVIPNGNPQTLGGKLKNKPWNPDIGLDFKKFMLYADPVADIDYDPKRELRGEVSHHHVIPKHRLRAFWNYCAKSGQAFRKLQQIFKPMLRAYYESKQESAWGRLNHFADQVLNGNINNVPNQYQSEMMRGSDEVALLHNLESVYYWPLWNIYAGPLPDRRKDDVQANRVALAQFDKKAKLIMPDELYRQLVTLNDHMENNRVNQAVELMKILYASEYNKYVPINPDYWAPTDYGREEDDGQRYIRWKLVANQRLLWQKGTEIRVYGDLKWWNRKILKISNDKVTIRYGSPYAQTITVDRYSPQLQTRPTRPPQPNSNGNNNGRQRSSSAPSQGSPQKQAKPSSMKQWLKKKGYPHYFQPDIDTAADILSNKLNLNFHHMGRYQRLGQGPEITVPQLMKQGFDRNAAMRVVDGILGDTNRAKSEYGNMYDDVYYDDHYADNQHYQEVMVIFFSGMVVASTCCVSLIIFTIFGIWNIYRYYQGKQGENSNDRDTHVL